MPALTKLLSLASLQGIADLLTGEGIRFSDFEMKFSNENNLMTIEEIYAIGPSISILMSGYVEMNKIVSLRGTLVPATTINRTISSIPVLANKPPWTEGCSVLTLPSIISGNIVISEMSVTAIPAERNASAVPPVEIISKDRPVKPFAKAASPVLSDTLMRARNFFLSLWLIHPTAYKS